MGYTKLRALLDKNIRRATSAVLLVSVGLATLAAFVQPLQDFILDNRVFEVLTIALLVDVITRLVELKPALVSVYRNQTDAHGDLIPYIQKHRPRAAKLLEYSTSSIVPLLEELRAVDATVQLLMFDPDTNPISQLQRDSIRHQLRHMASHIFRDYRKVEVRLYSTPAALRGRRLGDLIVVGWYTYFFDKGLPDLRGSNNPMIIMETKTTEGGHLSTMFERTFDELWESARVFQFPADTASGGVRGSPSA